MLCVIPDQIPLIDSYAEEVLGISTRTLMQRAGEAVAKEALSLLCEKDTSPKRICFLCGSGNNGGDGYAAASHLAELGHLITIVDIFGKGQRSEAGKHFLSLAEKKCRILKYDDLSPNEIQGIFAESEVIVDSILGTGAKAEPDCKLSSLATLVNSSKSKKLAVDIPLGADARNGELTSSYIKVDKTVTLSFSKRGLFSYPCRAVCGELVNCDLALPISKISKYFNIENTVTEEQTIKTLLPKRENNTHKGTYGKAVLFCGSKKYRGAALLAAESAIRTGCGLVSLCSTEDVICACVARLPECLYSTVPPLSEAKSDQLEALVADASAILIGSGSEKSENLAKIIESLTCSKGAPLIIDADGLNSIALLKKSEFSELLKNSKRELILTPHPAEMGRLCGVSVAEIQARRLYYAESFAKEHRLTLILKGAGSIITNGTITRIDSIGGPELAKGGSGDVLAGAVASFTAQGFSSLDACTLAVCLHSKAGKSLSLELSQYGVCPSELPIQISREINNILK